MQNHDFHARALREAQRYGQDSLVFLRELAQNSRDAGATRIEVVTEVDERGEWVHFDDDGCGMSFEHARSYLFRLYASSKERDPEAAGRFGVGFWSVLRFAPETIIVESRTTCDAWAVVLDAQLTTVQYAPCRKPDHGTRVSICRLHGRAGAAALAAEMEGGLHRYCRFLRRAGRGFEPLPVTCNGVLINQEMQLDGPISLAFRGRGAEGVVGLGERPRVELYARGLLVMSAATLDEIDPPPGGCSRAQKAGGLSPVVLLNSNRLGVVLSRERPKRDRVLHELARKARKRVRRLVGRVVEEAHPRSVWERFAEACLDLCETPGRLVAGVIALAAMAVMALGALSRVPQPLPPSTVPTTRKAPVVQPSPPLITPVPRAAPGMSMPAPQDAAPLLPYSNLTGYAGATVEVPDAGIAPWGLTYEGPRDILFRAMTLSRYDPQHGWLFAEGGVDSAYPEYRCRHGCVTVRLQVVAPAEPLVLPVPTGHRVERRSLRFNRAPVAELSMRDGDAAVKLPVGLNGVLEYSTGPWRSNVVPPTEAPAVALPSRLHTKLVAIERLAPGQRVQAVTSLVRERFAYDVSPRAARAFSAAPGDWLTRVLALQAGDCDIKNGLNVLLLRHVGIPARMAIGITGHDGHARPHLHAWTEYFLGGWRAVDATGSPRTSAPPLAPARAPVVASPVSLGADRAPPLLPRLPPIPASAANLDRLPPRPLERIASLSPARRGLEPAVWVVLIAGLAGALWLVYRRLRTREQIRTRGGRSSQEETLAAMLRDALAHPEDWRTISSLWHRRVLPTLERRPLSLVEAIEYGTRGHLFVSWRKSELARMAAAHGAPILDGGNAAFREVISMLGRAVDIDSVDKLRPAPADDPSLSHFAAALQPVNRLLRRFGGIECRLCPALVDAAVRDIDLSFLRLPTKAPWPQRFIAVSTMSPEIAPLARLLMEQQNRGIFLWIDWLLERSELLAGHACELRKRAAWSLLEDAV